MFILFAPYGQGQKKIICVCYFVSEAEKAKTFRVADFGGQKIFQ